MRATVLYGAGDVRIENVPDPEIVEPTDAVIRVTRACICGSDPRRPRPGDRDDDPDRPAA
jgi:threonine dehydrogenase-like Zn-dependent dehydrogenase